MGIAALEDKIVQQGVVTILNQIYEVDFKGFSYGFRPGRSPHQALDALAVGLERKKVNWVLDADICGNFDNLSHEWTVKFIEHRVADRRIIRLIQKWLKAGVSEDGQWSETSKGTPQGAVVSPLIANVYLHYTFDLWADVWRRKVAKGDVIIVRYADDTALGFQYRADARRFLEDFKERLAKFGLGLHPEKTRLIEFGRSTGCGIRYSHAAASVPAKGGRLSLRCSNGGYAPDSPAPLFPSSFLRHPSFIRAVCVDALVRICAGGDQRWSSLLRQLDRLCPSPGLPVISASLRSGRFRSNECNRLRIAGISELSRREAVEPESKTDSEAKMARKG